MRLRPGENPRRPATAADARRRHRTAIPLLGALLGACLALPVWSSAASAQGGEEIRVGYLLSRAGGFNTQDRAGVRMGEDELNQQAEVVGKRFRIVFAEGGRSSEVVAEAERLVKEQGVRALMGSVSPAATIALAEYAQEAGLVFFNIGSDVDSLRQNKCRRNAFSIGPSLTMHVRALGQWALQAKEWKSWAIVEGGSRGEGRLAETARDYLKANGGGVAGVIKLTDAESHAPVRALNAVRDLKPDFVFLALTGEAQELFLQAYQQAGIDTPVGGAEPELVRMYRGTSHFAGYWATGWSHLHEIFGASELNNRYADFAGIPMTGRSWAAWAGVKILGESILRAGSPAPDKLVPYLRDSLQFDGYMGESMNFRPWNQQLRQKLVIVQVNHQAAANGWDALTLETLVPLRRLKGWEGDPLDSIGFSAKESGCTF